ncbi:MAG: transporter [Planctomycetaceae bacterium]|nr:transporter [Planctomycetaceae bacterium]
MDESPDQSETDAVNAGWDQLPEFAQRRNSLVFILNTSIGYFVAPVFYVGVLHAAILSSVGFSDTISNLPESVYMWMLPFPVLIAWLWPSTHHLRPMLVVNYGFKGLAGVIAAALFLWAPPSWLAGGIVAHAAVIGITNGVTNMCLWELIGRGMTSARRGWTLGIAFGVGPVFAVLGSCASQLILNGNFLELIHLQPVPKPWCYVVLFGVTGPAMGMAAACVFLAHLPRTGPIESSVSLDGMTQGLRQYFTYRLIVIAVCGFLLTSAGGNMILNNLALFVRDATGESPDEYTGLQLALRFGCKSLFGFVLGWMLARYQAKTPALATTLICIAGLIWALAMPGKWYLFSFGLLGAGELFYVYYLNYIVGCSAPERIRENTAYTNVIMILVSFMPLVYGGISDNFGLRASFFVALGILAVATLVVWVLLPWRPVPATP